MRLTRPDPRDRLYEPDEEPWPERGLAKPRRGIGASLLGLLGSAALIVLGFAIAIVGVMAGVISRGQLLALFAGADPASLPPGAATQPASPPAVAATSPAPAAQQARRLRDETFGDWRFICIEGTAGAAPVCAATQQLLVAQSGAPVFVWRMVQDGQGGLVGIWQVPETVQLAAGLTLNAGTPQPVVLPFDSCGAGSCQVASKLTPDFIAALAATTTLSASAVLKNGQNVTFPLSPTGLADALAALRQ
jgi:invasion protein IalB